jgi:hypothetical protein
MNAQFVSWLGKTSIELFSATVTFSQTPIEAEQPEPGHAKHHRLFRRM